MIKSLSSIIFFIFCIIGFFSFFSCSDQEEDTPLPSTLVQTPQTEPNATQFTLTISASEGGTISTEGGTYDEGTEITITASPEEGYKFVGWEGSDSLSSTINITLNDNTTLQALFSLLPLQYTLTLSANEGGSVSTEGGIFDEGTQIAATATPDEGYRFLGWKGYDSNDNSILITVNSNSTITALFEAIPLFTISVASSQGGTVSSEGGTFTEGVQFTLTATPNSGYEFAGWEENDDLNPSLTITVTSDLTLTPIFNPVNNLDGQEDNEGPTYWRGNSLVFNKSDGADPNLETNQDRITDNVWITRGNTGGQIFNIAINVNANKTESPIGTEWAIGALDDIDNLEFNYFRNTVSKPKNVVGKSLVLHLIENNIYLSVKFTSWSSGKNGGFSYERSTP